MPAFTIAERELTFNFIKKCQYFVTTKKILCYLFLLCDSEIDNIKFSVWLKIAEDVHCIFVYFQDNEFYLLYKHTNAQYVSSF